MNSETQTTRYFWFVKAQTEAIAPWMVSSPFTKTKLSGITFIILFFVSQISIAQKLDYLFPIKPGKQNYLAGTMAELRANHFHGGLDIKTEGREGFPVYAAADGYVYRIKVSSFGYGNVLYLKHPDGNRTVYAHLQSFKKDIASYVLDKHYEKEAFEIDFEVDANKFPVKRGEIIAYSGNSGSSGGPHLHFEIRNSKDEPINPLYFNFSEIVDTMSPIVDAIAIQALDINARVKGEFGRITLKPYRTGRTYRIAQPIEVLGLVGLEFKGIDRANGTSNKYGINKVETFVDGELVYTHTLDAIPFELNRAMHVFTDFASWELKRTKFQRAYIAKGNPLPIFDKPQLDGKINVKEGQNYSVQLKLYDSVGNISTINLTLKGSAKISNNNAKAGTNNQIEVDENVLKIKSITQADTIELGFDYFNYKISKVYKKNGINTFLWDLRKGQPSSVKIGEEIINTHLKTVVPTNGKYTFLDENLTLIIPYNALFDTLYLQTKIEDKTLSLHNRLTPLFRPITVRWKPDFTVDNKEKMRIFTLSRRGRPQFLGGKWDGDEIVFRTNSFGKFFLDVDDQKPEVTLLNKTIQQVTFRISDRVSGIENFRAELNGKWLLMKYDHKKKLLRSEIGNYHDSLRGDFKLTVSDESGNITEYKRRF